MTLSPAICRYLLLGALLDTTLLFHLVTANIICSIVFGKRFDYKDPVFLRLLDMFYKSFSLISSFSSQVRAGGGMDGWKEGLGVGGHRQVNGGWGAEKDRL